MVLDCGNLCGGLGLIFQNSQKDVTLWWPYSSTAQKFLKAPFGEDILIKSTVIFFMPKQTE